MSRPSTPKNKVRGQRRHSSSKNRVRRQRRQLDGDLSSKVLSPRGLVSKITVPLSDGESSVSGGEDTNEDLLISVSKAAVDIPAEVDAVIDTAKDVIDNVSSALSDVSAFQASLKIIQRKLNTSRFFFSPRPIMGFVSIIFNQRNRACSLSSI